MRNRGSEIGGNGISYLSVSFGLPTTEFVSRRKSLNSDGLIQSQPSKPIGGIAESKRFSATHQVGVIPSTQLDWPPCRVFFINDWCLFPPIDACKVAEWPSGLIGRP